MLSSLIYLGELEQDVKQLSMLSSRDKIFWHTDIQLNKKKGWQQLRLVNEEGYVSLIIIIETEKKDYVHD